MLHLKKPGLRLVTLLIISAFVTAFYHEIIFHPGNYTFGWEGDGLKNYYFAKYYINDSGAELNHLRGMNYPYGENLNYADAQPLLTWIFKWINMHLFNTGNGFVTATFILFLISIPLSGLVLLEIFFHYRITGWLAAVFACAIALLSPQIQRITFHVYLSYSFVLPAAWLLFLIFKNNQRIAAAAVLVLFTAMAGYLHPYYTALCAAMIFFLIVMERSFSLRHKFKYVLALAVLPVIIYRLILLIGYQGLSDFAQHPYGAFGEAYRSRPEDVFFPNQASEWNRVLNLRWIAHAGYEGEAFTGWALTLTGFAFIAYVIVTGIRNKSFSQFSYFKTSRGLLISACIIFIFSAGALHFILPIEIQDRVPSFLTQFRTYGRLAWINYYFLSVFLCITFYFFISKPVASYIKVMLCFLFIALCIADAAEMNMRVAKLLKERKMEMDNKAYLPLLNGINARAYQAIISLPYFHMISPVKEAREPHPGQMLPALQLSLITGLPLTNTNVSRTSATHARSQLDFYSGKNKNVLNHFKNKKPLLVLVSKDDRAGILNRTVEKASFYPNEIKIIERARLLRQTENLLLYEIKFNDLVKL